MKTKKHSKKFTKTLKGGGKPNPEPNPKRQKIEDNTLSEMEIDTDNNNLPPPPSKLVPPHPQREMETDYYESDPDDVIGEILQTNDANDYICNDKEIIKEQIKDEPNKYIYYLNRLSYEDVQSFIHVNLEELGKKMSAPLLDKMSSIFHVDDNNDVQCEFQEIIDSVRGNEYFDIVPEIKEGFHNYQKKLNEGDYNISFDEIPLCFLILRGGSQNPNHVTLILLLRNKLYTMGYGGENNEFYSKIPTSTGKGYVSVYKGEGIVNTPDDTIQPDVENGLLFFQIMTPEIFEKIRTIIKKYYFDIEINGGKIILQRQFDCTYKSYIASPDDDEFSCSSFAKYLFPQINCESPVNQSDVENFQRYPSNYIREQVIEAVKNKNYNITHAKYCQTLDDGFQRFFIYTIVDFEKEFDKNKLIKNNKTLHDIIKIFEELTLIINDVMKIKNATNDQTENEKISQFRNHILSINNVISEKNKHFYIFLDILFINNNFIYQQINLQDEPHYIPPVKKLYIDYIEFLSNLINFCKQYSNFETFITDLERKIKNILETNKYNDNLNAFTTNNIGGVVSLINIFHRNKKEQNNIDKDKLTLIFNEMCEIEKRYQDLLATQQNNPSTPPKGGQKQYKKRITRRNNFRKRM